MKKFSDNQETLAERLIKATVERRGNKIIAALYTWAIPGYWLQDANGENHFSAYGNELTAEQKSIVHSFPCNCFKKI